MGTSLGVIFVGASENMVYPDRRMSKGTINLYPDTTFLEALNVLANMYGIKDVMFQTWQVRKFE